MLKNDDSIEEILEANTNDLLDTFDQAVLAKIEALRAKLDAAHTANNPIAVAEYGVAIMHLIQLMVLTSRAASAACDMAYDMSLDHFEQVVQRILDGSYDQRQTVSATKRDIRQFTARLRDLDTDTPTYTGPGGQA